MKAICRFTFFSPYVVSIIHGAIGNWSNLYWSRLKTANEDGSRRSDIAIMNNELLSFRWMETPTEKKYAEQCLLLISMENQLKVVSAPRRDRAIYFSAQASELVRRSSPVAA